MHFQLAANESAEWKKIGLSNIPAGWRAYARYDEGLPGIVIGIEPTNKEPPKEDKWGKMSIEDLKAMAGRKAIPYNEGTTKQSLIEALRAKG